MQTATVRELRNNFAEITKTIESGGSVVITRHGKDFATLTPARKPKSKNDLRAIWRARLKNYKPVGRRLTKAETEAFWSRMRD